MLLLLACVPFSELHLADACKAALECFRWAQECPESAQESKPHASRTAW